MANVFISHAGADSGLAEIVRRWLVEDGHQTFLDRNIDDGVLPGDEWEDRLYAELRKADAVVCIVTLAYLKSVWCAAEIGAARGLGSVLLPLQFSLGGERHSLLSPIHEVDATQDPEGARDRLRMKLGIIDGTGGRGWADDQSPYPGLRPFEVDEHRVFFGRKVEIEQIGEQLRSPAKRSIPEVLAIVGSSGCGKSSLVRAGVLPRIASDALFLPLAPMVPGSDPIGGLEREFAALVKNRHFDAQVRSLRGSGPERLKDLANDVLLAAGADSRCKLVVFIDQFEELLTQTSAADRANFVEALAPTLGGPIQVLATLRPEFLEQVSTDPHLAKLAPRVFLVHPLETDALRSVIGSPAQVAGFTIDEDLVNRLVTDTGTGEALPLLAFALERLAVGVKRGQELSLQRYLDLGGVERALTLQADTALQDACTQAAVPPDRVLSALLGLVQVDEQGRPTKRRVAFENSVRELFEPFVDRRLLSVEADGAFVSVAHEAFLVTWKPLRDEIDARQTALRARRVVENEAADWVAGGRDPRLLLQTGKLTKATVDTGAELEPVRDSVGGQTSAPKRYFGLPRLGFRQRRLVTRVELNDTGRAFLEASIRTDRSRRRRRTIEVICVIVILAVAAVTAGVGLVQANHAKGQAQASARRAIASRLLNEAADMLALKRPGGDVQALQEVVAAHVLAPDTAAGGLFDAVMNRLTTAKIVDFGDVASYVAFRPDGHLIAFSIHAGDVYGSMRLQVLRHDVDGGPNDGGVVLDRNGNSDDKISLAFSPDGQHLAGSVDGEVHVWNTDTGEVQVWNTDGPPLGAPLTGHADDVDNLALSPNGHQLVSASRDGMLRVWNVDTHRPLGAALTPIDMTLGDSTGSSGMSILALGPDGHRLATGSSDGAVQVWNVDTGHSLGTPVSGHKDEVTAMAFSLDGHRLATGSLDGTLRLWNADTGQPLGNPLTGHTDRVNSVAFSPDGRLASGSADQTVRLWNADGQPLGAPLTGHRQQVLSVAFSPDGQRLASGSIDDTVRLWNVDAGQPVRLGHTDKVWDAAFSTDRRRLAAVGSGGTVGVWEADTGQPLRALMTEKTVMSSVAFSPDGQRLATGSTDGTLQLWDADTGHPLSGPLTGHTDFVSTLAFSPDGQHLASGGHDKTVRLWNADTGGPLGGPLIGHADWVNSVAFSSDGKLLASAGRDGTVLVWDVDTRQPHGVPLTQPVTVSATSVAFSPDGHRLAVGYNMAVRLWNIDTSRSSGAQLTGHTDAVSTLAFSRDGRRLASGGQDNTVRLWDTETGQPIGGPLPGPTAEVMSVAFSPDGQRLFTASNDSRVWIWPAVGTEQMLCDKLTTNMSGEQWREWISADFDYVMLCPRLPIPPE